MKVLDLFSGIGGMSLGLERAGFETVAFCEIEPFPRRVLAHHWPEVPCFHDVRTAPFDSIGPVDLVAAGFPCQRTRCRTCRRAFGTFLGNPTSRSHGGTAKAVAGERGSVA